MAAWAGEDGRNLDEASTKAIHLVSTMRAGIVAVIEDRSGRWRVVVAAGTSGGATATSPFRRNVVDLPTHAVDTGQSPYRPTYV